MVFDRVTELAKTRGLTRAQVAFAWILHKSPVVSPVVGATKPSHLDDPIAALSVKLSANEIHFLEELYVPHMITQLQGSYDHNRQWQ